MPRPMTLRHVVHDTKSHEMTRCDTRETKNQNAVVRVRLPGIVYDCSVYQALGKKENKVVENRPTNKPTDRPTESPPKKKKKKEGRKRHKKTPVTLYIVSVVVVLPASIHPASKREKTRQNKKRQQPNTVRAARA